MIAGSSIVISTGVTHGHWLPGEKHYQLDMAETWLCSMWNWRWNWSQYDPWMVVQNNSHTFWWCCILDNEIVIDTHWATSFHVSHIFLPVKPVKLADSARFGVPCWPIVQGGSSWPPRNWVWRCAQAAWLVFGIWKSQNPMVERVFIMNFPTEECAVG